VRGGGPGAHGNSMGGVVCGGERFLEPPVIRTQRERTAGQDLCHGGGYLRPVRGRENDTCSWHSQRMAPCSALAGPGRPATGNRSCFGFRPDLALLPVDIPRGTGPSIACRRGRTGRRLKPTRRE